MHAKRLSLLGNAGNGDESIPSVSRYGGWNIEEEMLKKSDGLRLCSNAAYGQD
jgi:hypothetical protein